MKKFKVAFEGLWLALKDKSVRIQLGFAALAMVAGVIFQFSQIEWLLVTLCIGLVLAAEIFNTCLERLCDVVQPNQDPRIKAIKDMAGAAVLVLAITALILGLTIVAAHWPV